MHSFLTEPTASLAIRMAVPSIDFAMQNGIAKRGHLHIVVALRKTNPDPDVLSMLPADKYYLPVAEHSIGDPNSWDFPYDEIAHGKTLITARTGLPSREVQLLHPELLLDSDVKYWGSVISGDMIVACSGVQPWYDEQFANIVLGFCRAQIDQIVVDKRSDDTSSFYDR